MGSVLAGNRGREVVSASPQADITACSVATVGETLTSISAACEKLLQALSLVDDGVKSLRVSLQELAKDFSAAGEYSEKILDTSDVEKRRKSPEQEKRKIMLNYGYPFAYLDHVVEV